MDIKKLNIADIKPAKYNPRKDLQSGDVEYEKIKRSIMEFDLVEPLVVNKQTGNLVGGHQRLKVLKELGKTEVEAVIVDLPESREKALNIALNKAQGEWDLPKLKDLLLEIDTGEFDIGITGFDEKEIEDLMNQLFVPDENEKDDDVPDVPEEPITKKGDLYKLGEHRLLCGDATIINDVEKLMDGQKADMVFTDPPYNLNYQYNSYSDSKTKQEYLDFCRGWFHNLTLLTDKIIITCGKQNIYLWNDIKTPSETCVWVAKNKMSGGSVSNLSLWEPLIFYGKFNRNSRPTDVFEYNVKSQSDTGDHTCPKIIDFIVDIINSYSKASDLILDIFGGSGSTLIACEKLNRKCFMMELDEHYCDVIVKRWEDYTGKKAELVLDEIHT